MRIVIDMQVVQTEGCLSSLGRYTLSFAKAVIQNRGSHEVFLALNGMLEDSIEPIRALFDKILPQDNIRLWYFSVLETDKKSGKFYNLDVAELIRESFLNSLNPDVIHITSQVGSGINGNVTSIGRYDKFTPVSVSLYDPIPLKTFNQSETESATNKSYYHHIYESFIKANIFLGVSNYTCENMHKYTGIPRENTVNISLGVENCHQSYGVSNKYSGELLKRFCINMQFILYVFGDNDQEYLFNLISAYSKLSRSIRAKHQLILTGQISSERLALLKEHGKKNKLSDNEFIITGKVDSCALSVFYKHCKLFVSPLGHESVCFRVLEAMKNGAAVIGANNSSNHNIINLVEATFNRNEINSIAEKIKQVIEDDCFYKHLKKSSLSQAKLFSWDRTARKAIEAWMSLQSSKYPDNNATAQKPKLAFVTPLPPVHSGIADYSSMLIPALERFYDIELVVNQDRVWLSGFNKNKIRNVSWFIDNSGEFDRVLYHLGNSYHHHHMIPLIRHIPGVVVLHDFYLSGLLAWMESHNIRSNVWLKSLFDSHGYNAIQARYCDVAKTQEKYPVNFEVLRDAQGIIVHSEFSRKLADRWYGKGTSKLWAKVPLVRKLTKKMNRNESRVKLDISEETFLVCSFGFLGENKQSLRLLHAWCSSALSSNNCCKLIFVGENYDNDYGLKIKEFIRTKRLEEQVIITGYVLPEIFHNYLSAADLAVQLRTMSRGETSAAVFDCMNYSLPLIINANGSMAEINQDAAWILPDHFSDESLVDALEILWKNKELRQSLGSNAQKIICENHAPEICAKSYVKAIEKFSKQGNLSTSTLIKAITKLECFKLKNKNIHTLAKDIEKSLPFKKTSRRLLLDISATNAVNLKTGIERVVSALTSNLIASSDSIGYQVKPVYLIKNANMWGYRHATRFTLELMGCPTAGLEEEPIEPESDDILLILDFSGENFIQAKEAGLYDAYRNHGVQIFAVVYDLLPIYMPEVFPRKAGQIYLKWLNAVSSLHGAVCISKTVSDQLTEWQHEGDFSNIDRRPFKIKWFHLGADLLNSFPSKGLPFNARYFLKKIPQRLSFLMVGTIEPRKGYLQVLRAFEELWSSDIDINLIIVGREGWGGIPECFQRDIPETISFLRNSSQRNRRLFWLKNISDEYLELVYSKSTCLIAASYGEGFGLPLIEAAKHGLPIIARDIPVFREVAGEYVYYFDANNDNALNESIYDWLQLYKENKHPISNEMPFSTWYSSCQGLMEIITSEMSCPTDRSS